jgi:Protein of unknown function (DUF4236)
VGFYIRKAIRVGPLRFNLSKSGVGVSAGIKGLRVGAGPRGHYIHMGRGGLYFRQTLSPSRPSSDPGPASHLPTVACTASEFQEIESSSVLRMADGSSADLLKELNEKRQRLRLLPFAVSGAAVVIMSLITAAAPSWAVVAALLACVAGCWLAATRDTMRRTTVMMYDLEPDVAKAYEAIHSAFQDLKGCGRVWHVEAKADVLDGKYHAGAGNIIKRSVVSVTIGQPALVKTNIDVPLLQAGRQVLAFMPDRLLVLEPSAVGAVSYTDLVLEHRDTRFVEEQDPPSDATVIDRTWRYVNKSGGPDRRFKDNPELPICAYSQLRFFSDSGLNEIFQISRRAVGESQRVALAEMCRMSNRRDGETGAAARDLIERQTAGNQS